jgi:No apical meristem-associated C-terminal domain
LKIKKKDGTLEEGEVFVQRKSSALLDRFQRKIAKETQVLNGFLRQRHRLNESGKNDGDRLKDALEDYKSQNGGKPFQFSHCLRILHGIPKYSLNPPEERPESRASIGSRASQDSAQDNADNEERQVNDVAGSMQARSWERPKGTKAAKILADQTRQRNYWNSMKIKVSKKLNKDRVEAMNKLTASTKRSADILQFSSWQNAISARVGHLILLGEEDMARALLAKTEARITNLPQDIVAIPALNADEVAIPALNADEDEDEEDEENDDKDDEDDEGDDDDESSTDDDDNGPSDAKTGKPKDDDDYDTDDSLFDRGTKKTAV